MKIYYGLSALIILLVIALGVFWTTPLSNTTTLFLYKAPTGAYNIQAVFNKALAKAKGTGKMSGEQAFKNAAYQTAHDPILSKAFDTTALSHGVYDAALASGANLSTAQDAFTAAGGKHGGKGRHNYGATL